MPFLNSRNPKCLLAVSNRESVIDLVQSSRRHLEEENSSATFGAFVFFRVPLLRLDYPSVTLAVTLFLRLFSQTQRRKSSRRKKRRRRGGSDGSTVSLWQRWGSKSREFHCGFPISKLTHYLNRVFSLTVIREKRYVSEMRCTSPHECQMIGSKW